MLQQTRVATVRPYYARFLQRFPDLASLAAAPLEEVLQAWAGLGYYARARRAHACAQNLAGEHGGQFPTSSSALERLPGVGPSTAAAIAAFCFEERAAILDANVARVLARRFAIEGRASTALVRRQLWERARALAAAAEHIGPYTQAIMDLGAIVCTRTQPRCTQCPVRANCRAHQDGRVEQLPSRMRRASRPVRRAHVLVAVAGRSVFLEQRAASGIWGGMLSFPQFSTRQALERAAAGFGGGKPRELAKRTHGFSHFTLAFAPHLLRLARVPRQPVAMPGRWLALARTEQAALPSPVRALLRDLREGRAERSAV